MWHPRMPRNWHRRCRGCRPDLLADSVELLVQRLLLIGSEVAAIQRGHLPLLLPDRTDLAAQLLRLICAQRAAVEPVLDPAHLIIDTAIDLSPARMRIRPGARLNCD